MNVRDCLACDSYTYVSLSFVANNQGKKQVGLRMMSMSSVGLSKPESIGICLLTDIKFDDKMWRAKMINRRVWWEYDKIEITVGGIGGFPLEADVVACFTVA